MRVPAGPLGVADAVGDGVDLPETDATVRFDNLGPPFSLFHVGFPTPLLRGCCSLGGGSQHWRRCCWFALARSRCHSCCRRRHRAFIFVVAAFVIAAVVATVVAPTTLCGPTNSSATSPRAHRRVEVKISNFSGVPFVTRPDGRTAGGLTSVEQRRLQQRQDIRNDAFLHALIKRRVAEEAWGVVGLEHIRAPAVRHQNVEAEQLKALPAVGEGSAAAEGVGVGAKGERLGRRRCGSAVCRSSSSRCCCSGGSGCGVVED